MPQPMSTPTAAGMMAPVVGITEPTVAPMPTWASGMRATWPSTIGRRAVFSAWRMVPSSTSLAQEMSLSLIVVAIVFSLQYVTTEQASDAYRRSDSNGHWAGFGPAASALGYGGVGSRAWARTRNDAGSKARRVCQFPYSRAAGAGGLEPPISWVRARRVTSSPTRHRTVGRGGFEPPTSRIRPECSSFDELEALDSWNVLVAGTGAAPVGPGL